MTFFNEIKNWLIRTFIVLISFLCLTISSVSVNSINYKEAHRSNSSIDTKIAEETVLKSIENDSANCCQNEKDLVDYRNLAKCCEANATKGGGLADDLVKVSHHTFSSWLKLIKKQ